MGNTPSPLLGFRNALLELEGHLCQSRWEEAGKAGESLAGAVAACQEANVVLSTAALNDAKNLFEHCIALTDEWGKRLNEQAHASANTSRALQSYGG